MWTNHTLLTMLVAFFFVSCIEDSKSGVPDESATAPVVVSTTEP